MHSIILISTKSYLEIKEIDNKTFYSIPLKYI